MPGSLDEADPGEELGVAVNRLEVEPLVVGLEVGAVERAVEAEGPLLLLGVPVAIPDLRRYIVS